MADGFVNVLAQGWDPTQVQRNVLAAEREKLAIEEAKQRMANYPEERNWLRKARAFQEKEWGWKQEEEQRRKDWEPVKNEKEAMEFLDELNPMLTPENYDASVAHLAKFKKIAPLPTLNDFKMMFNQEVISKGYLPPDQWDEEFRKWFPKKRTDLLTSQKQKMAERLLKTKEIEAEATLAKATQEERTNDQKNFEAENPDMKGKAGTPEYGKRFGMFMAEKSPNEYKDFMEKELREGKTRDQAVVNWGNLQMQRYQQRLTIQSQEQAKDLMSDEDAKWMANKLATKQMVPSQLRTFIGFGSVGQKNLSKIVKQLRKDYPDYNFSMVELAFTGDKTEINRQKGIMGNIVSFENTAIQNAKQVDALSRKIGVSRIPILNDAILAGKTLVGGSEIEAQYIASWRTIINEYARIATSVSGGGITSDAARKEIEAVLKKNYTPAQVQSVIRQLVLEMEHRRYGFEKGLHDVMTNWGEPSSLEPKLPTRESIENIFKSETPLVGEAGRKGEAPTGGKKIKQQFYSPSTGKTKYVYEDGTTEIK